MTNKMPATPELLGALATSEADVLSFQGTISHEILTVQNTKDEVNLTLPFYANVDKYKAALADSEMSSVSGGYSRADEQRVYDAVNEVVTQEWLDSFGAINIAFDVQENIDRLNRGQPVHIELVYAKKGK